MRRLFAMLAALALLFALPPGSSIRAQETAPAVTKQELARTKFKELTERMQKLEAILAKTSPEDVAVLKVARQFIQEAKIHENLNTTKLFLDEERWDDALQLMQDKVRKDLAKLLDILQNRDHDLAKLLAEIAKLQGFRNRVDDLAKQQGKEKDDSAKTEALQKHLEAIEAAKNATEALLAAQKELREATNQLGTQAAAGATEPLANKEGDLQKDAEKLAADLAALEKEAEALKSSAGDAGKPADGAKPADGKPSDGQPSEGSKPSESQPSDSKPSDSKPSDAKPSKPSDSKSPGGKSGKASKSAGQASESMGQAQKQLNDNAPEPSLKDQDQAIEKLKSTVKELEDMAEEARRELLKLPFEQQAKNQEDTQHATDTLSKDMEKSEQEGEKGDGSPTPGRKRVQQAVPKQKSAAGSLKEYKPAKQKQQDAKEDLEEARKELDDALAQLRQQLQDEVLRALEERFTAMLAKQRDLSINTKALDKTRQNVLTSDGNLPASLAEKIQGIGSGEADLQAEARDALKLLEEEGTTAVFPEIVQELIDQLGGVSKLCRANETNKVVQTKQAEVEDTLTLLINSLRRTIEKRENGQC